MTNISPRDFSSHSCAQVPAKQIDAASRLPPPTSRMDDIFMKTILQLSCMWSSCAGTFEVSTPQRKVMAVHGRPVVLGCRYTVSSHAALDDLVLTWQTEDGTRVLHSFYYGKDQLKQQSSDFQNRTSLFHTELLAGNASLRLADVGPRDTGSYLCSVSSQGGTSKAEVHLEYAAFYSEPRLSIEVQPTSMIFQYESEGFPEPEVSWRGPAGHNLSHESVVFSQDGQEGLLFLRSQLVLVNSSLAANFTFTLHNRVLDQLLKRTVSFHQGHPRGCVGHLENPKHRLVVLLSIFSLLLVTSLVLWGKLAGGQKICRKPEPSDIQ